MDQRNGSTPHPVVSQALFDQLNRLAERFAEAAAICQNVWPRCAKRLAALFRIVMLT
jgi:hypothetical protein